MTSLAYGRATYRRQAAGLPELRLVNMYVESAATSQDGIVLLNRPGLRQDQTKGSGPIRGLFYQDGTLSNTLFAISGDRLIGSMDLGAVNGTGPVSFAASATEIVVTAGASMLRASETTAVPVTFPDGASVTSVAYLGGFFIALRAGSQRFYWSKLRDATSWDALDYASAESSPDPLLDVAVTGDVMWLLGTSTIEPWALSGDATLPFSRVEGRNYQRGVKGTGCAAALDNSLFWIGDDNRVYRSGAAPDGLSDPGIEERIAAATAVSAYAFEQTGHKFFCVRLDAETVCYDVATREWSENDSFQRANFRPRCAVQVHGKPLLGDDSSGIIWSLDPAAYDDAAQPISKVFTAFQPVQDGSFSLDVVHLDADFGSTPALVGQGADPIVEVRTSRDGGRTWSEWRQSRLGRQGQYRARASWRRFGSFDAPGGIFEFRCTDPVRFRVSAVRSNEAQGGRSR